VFAGLDLADEAEALARDRPQQVLIVAGVADGLASCVDVTGDRRFRDDPARPDRLQQFVLGDDPVAVTHEVQQQVEDLRADGHDLRAMRKLPAFPVEHVVSKCEPHLGVSFDPSMLRLGRKNKRS
jgi:hypothetical protein